MPNPPPLAKQNNGWRDRDPRNTSAWRKVRKAHRDIHPICQRCSYLGTVTGDSTKRLSVHHIVGLDTANSEGGRYALCMDGNNLLTLCQACHQRFDHMELYGMREEAEDEGKEIRDA